MTRLLAAAGCLLVMACSAPEAESDLLLHHGKIFTADTTRPWAEAVLVRGERIVAVGPNDSVMALAGGATTIDLEGATVVPGFNDAHVHLYPGPAPVTVVADPNPTADPDLALVLDSLRAAVARTPAGTRLSVSVGERILSDPRARRAALDAVAPEHRVELVAWSGHGLVLNSAALAAAGVRDDAPDPVGGRYERSARGLTGLMEEYAGFRAYAQLADTSDAAVREALTAYAAEVVPLGTTSIQIMATAMTPEAIGRLGSDFSIPLETRIIRFPLTTATHRERDRWQAISGARGPSLRISGTKYVLDGTPVERLAVLRGTYADRRGWFGRLDFPPDTVRAILAEAVAS
ncbi:MAG: amidohydrolase family protein, partial [Gemmatimonadales bacterium]